MDFILTVFADTGTGQTEFLTKIQTGIYCGIVSSSLASCCSFGVAEKGAPRLYVRHTRLGAGAAGRCVSAQPRVSVFWVRARRLSSREQLLLQEDFAWHW